MLFSQIRQCLLIGLSRCLARALSSIFEANLRSSERFAEGKEAVGAFVHSLGVLDSHLSHTITVYRLFFRWIAGENTRYSPIVTGVIGVDYQLR